MLCSSGPIQGLTLGVQQFSQAQLLFSSVEGLLEIVDRIGFGQLLEVNDVRPGEETEGLLRGWVCPGWDREGISPHGTRPTLTLGQSPFILQLANYQILQEAA